MKYEWERQIEAMMVQVADLLPDDIMLVGLAVENSEGEGALVSSSANHAHGSILEADICQDILGDAKRRYEAAHIAAFGIFNQIEEAE